MQHYENFIDNEFAGSAAQSRIEVINPATEQVVALVDTASPEDASHDIRRAAAAQKQWRRLPAAERPKVLHRLADALVERADRIGAALALESGESPALSRRVGKPHHRRNHPERQAQRKPPALSRAHRRCRLPHPV